MQNQEFHDALHHFTYAVEFNPQYGLAHNNLAVTYEQVSFEFNFNVIDY